MKNKGLFKILKQLLNKDYNYFDPEVWKTRTDKRKYFVRYILKNNFLTGLSEDDVIQNLGYDRQIFMDKEVWSYSLGNSQGEYLLVYFKNHRVCKLTKTSSKKIY